MRQLKLSLAARLARCRRQWKLLPSVLSRDAVPSAWEVKHANPSKIYIERLRAKRQLTKTVRKLEKKPNVLDDAGPGVLDTWDGAPPA